MLREDKEFYTGRLAESAQTVAPPATPVGVTTTIAAGAQQTFQGFVTRIPIEINQEALDRGQERFRQPDLARCRATRAL
jgi:hypothetical protein